MAFLVLVPGPGLRGSSGNSSAVNNAGSGVSDAAASVFDVAGASCVSGVPETCNGGVDAIHQPVNLFPEVAMTPSANSVMVGRWSVNMTLRPYSTAIMGEKLL